jgi:endogenous inhibitor of DNA gyrase (YacG/DUF329 family)
MLQPKCVECDKQLPGSHIHRKYCSQRCKHKWRKKHGPREPVLSHTCRICGAQISIGPGQGNKWLCSVECRRTSNTTSVRTFHQRRPQQEAIYRERTKAKKLPDSNLARFRKTNPNAPHACEACGETRVLDTAHKPTCRRLGAWRSKQNCKWPEMVWVLCPTCHALLDRMHYPPEELGLRP